MEKTTVELKVTGIHCPKCVAALEKQAAGTAGILSLQVGEGTEARIITVDYDAEIADVPAMIAMIENTPGKEFLVENLDY